MTAPNNYSTATLVDNVLLLAHIPISNNTFTTANIITLANRELQTSLIAQITSVREAYYADNIELDNNATGIYDIPSQAIGGALIGIQIVQSESVLPVNRLEEMEQFSTNAPTSTSYGYFIRGNKIHVLPTPNIGTLRISFLRRPNALTAISAAGQITAINGAVITVSSLPTTFTVGTTVNLCQDQPTFNVLGEREITAVNSLDVTLDSAVDDLTEGDWLCLDNQTPVPQIPVEFRPILEQRVVVKMYELQGYLEKKKVAEEKLEEMMSDLYKLITPRVQSQTKVINPTNGGFGNNNGKYNSIFWSTR